MSTGLGISTGAEADAILAKLKTLTADCVEGVPQGEEMDTDAFNQRPAYRDVSFGSVVPAGGMRGSLASDMDDIPHMWTFEVKHTGTSKSEVRRLTQETDLTLVGWSPSENATQIRPYYFVQYESRNQAGAILSYTANRFYSVIIGASAP